MILIVLAFIALSISSHVHCLQSQDPDQFRDASQIIRSRGFLVEEHRVVTPDGYILTLHRIVNPYVSKYRRKKPLLLMHGILASATDWLMNLPGVLTPDGDYVEERYIMPTAYRPLNGRNVPIGGSTAFVLAQFGYDVWLGNCRGTTHSRQHTRLDWRFDKKYWMFSIDHVALFDIPTMINHVLRTTRKASLGYICHSMGCTVMFALQSAKPQYGRRLSELIALSPVVFDTNTMLITNTLLLRHISPLLRPILRALPSGFLRFPLPLLQLQGVLCRDKSLRYVCGTLLGLVTGINLKGILHDRLAAFATKYPSGVSTWVLAHFMQWAITGKFAKFDHGSQRNLAVYGQSSPPEYQLSRIRIKKISIFYSVNDQISEYRNVLAIKRYLSVPLYSETQIGDPNWGHFDYFVAKNVGFFLNAKIIDLLRSSQSVTYGKHHYL